MVTYHARHLSADKNYYILTIIDRSSKAAHFGALDKLPTTTETTQILVFQRTFSFSEDYL